MKIYKVTATRDDGWWVINAEVPGAFVWTQARRLEQVEPMARDAIALTLDVPEDSFGLNVITNIPEEIRVQVEAAKQLAELSEEFQSLTAQLRRQLAADLRDSGFTVRDSGELIGVSSQRISQLLADVSPESSPSDTSALVANIANHLKPAQELLDEVARTRIHDSTSKRG
jgi:predicted transcriptional regulator/predicted RNase H-like HicB family nuclease